MGRIAQRVEDPRLRKLIRAFLNTGVMENGLVGPSVDGTPQGGPLSPCSATSYANLVAQRLPLLVGASAFPSGFSRVNAWVAVIVEATSQEGEHTDVAMEATGVYWKNHEGAPSPTQDVSGSVSACVWARS
jgi:hypothetical protein